MPDVVLAGKESNTEDGMVNCPAETGAVQRNCTVVVVTSETCPELPMITA
jgi:hypothetical protein